ncbi:CPBP family glutamic-type intramembrane protease [Mucilaginibacter sp. UYCu711]|uniref:CPBP family glutamic-type intramembrane protease n=1 Tax=Mucilaginibacter sp. UYCu711 TaxID=3156339 RepID=UPI003D1C0F9B
MRYSPKIRAIAYALLFYLGCVVLFVLASSVTSNLPAAYKELLSLSTAVVLTFGLTLLFVKWKKLQLKDAGIAFKKVNGYQFLFGFMAGLIMTIVQLSIMTLTGHISLTQISTTGFGTVLINFALYTMVALREEMAFRGYPLFTIKGATGPWVAQGIIFCVFVIEHVFGGMTWTQALLGSGTGAILFGLAALKTNNLALGFGLHTAWNFSQWTLGYKGYAGLYALNIDKGYEQTIDMVSWGAYLFVMWVMIGLIGFYKGKPVS